MIIVRKCDCDTYDKLKELGLERENLENHVLFVPFCVFEINDLTKLLESKRINYTIIKIFSDNTGELITNNNHSQSQLDEYILLLGSISDEERNIRKKDLMNIYKYDKYTDRDIYISNNMRNISKLVKEIKDNSDLIIWYYEKSEEKE